MTSFNLNYLHEGPAPHIVSWMLELQHMDFAGTQFSPKHKDILTGERRDRVKSRNMYKGPMDKANSQGED